MNGFIYKITNDINNKVYIGKTLSSIEKRFNEHLKDSVRERCEKRPLYDAMNKYGIDHFNVELVEEAPVEILNERECYWISQYQSYHNGYNATIGGDGKQLYDYDGMVVAYLNGKLVKEIADDFKCSVDTVAKALALAKIDSTTNGFQRLKKSIVAKTLTGEIVEIFNSRKEASQWLQINGYTKSTDIDNISATIGRVANGQRKSAYNLLWENL